MVGGGVCPGFLAIVTIEIRISWTRAELVILMAHKINKMATKFLNS